MNVEACVRDFMEAVGQLEGSSFDSTKDLRISLIDEEYTELIEAINWGEKVQIAKELADLVYVVVGSAVAWDIPFNDIFACVCNSNMSKLDENGEAIRRPDGKILKGPNYVPAETSIKEVLRTK